MPQKRKTRKHLPKRKKRFSLGRLRKSENSRKRDGARVTRKNKKGGAVGSVLVGGAVFVTMYPLFLLWSMQKLIGVSHDFGMQMIGSGGALGLSCTAGNFKKHFAVVKGFKFKQFNKDLFKIKKIMGINGRLCIRRVNNYDGSIMPSGDLIKKIKTPTDDVEGETALSKLPSSKETDETKKKEEEINNAKRKRDADNEIKKLKKSVIMSPDYYVFPVIKEDRYPKELKRAEQNPVFKKPAAKSKPKRNSIPSTVERPLRKIIQRLEKMRRALELCQRCYLLNKDHPTGDRKMFEQWDVEVKVMGGERIPYYKKLFQMYRNECLHTIAVVGSISEELLKKSPALYKESIVPVDINLWLECGVCAVTYPDYLKELLGNYGKDEAECISFDDAKKHYNKANTIALERLAVDKLKLIAQMPVAPLKEAAPAPAAGGAAPKAAPKAGAGQGAGQGAGAGKRVQAGGALQPKDDCNSLPKIEILKELLKKPPNVISIETGIEAVKELDELLRQGTISEECKRKIKELEHTEINQAIDMIDTIREQQEQAKMTQQECSDDSNLECRFKKLDETYKIQRGDLSFEDSVAALAEAYAVSTLGKDERILKITELQKMVGPKDPAKKRVETALEKANLAKAEPVAAAAPEAVATEPEAAGEPEAAEER